MKYFILLTIFKFLRTVSSFIYRLKDVENAATCPEIGTKTPKIVLNTFKGKERIKESVFVLIPFLTLIWDKKA